MIHAPVLKHLVLVGGGHAHVHVLKSFGMRPMPGVRLTLVSREGETPYSGMIPGFVAGTYSFEECHIDLARLGAATGARFIQAEATGIDRVQRQLLLRNRPPLAYDLLSIDVGSTPGAAAIPGASEHALIVRPISTFGDRWLEFHRTLAGRTGSLAATVVGGGAGGTELALALRARLGRDAPHLAIAVRLVTQGEVLARHPPAARAAARRMLARRGIDLIEGVGVTAIEAEAITLVGGRRLTSDTTLVVTDATAPRWLAATGLACDDGGFLAVDATLQSPDDPAIFAAGDCAAVRAHPRPKAGVFAVRQGPPLAENLRRALLGQPPHPFTPQSSYLALIGSGDGEAIAVRGGLALTGRWAWRLKDWIDRRWMAMYRDPAPMTMSREPSPPDPALADAEAKRLLQDIGMRCGGCGAKVGASALQRVLARLGPSPGADVALGLEAPDDAALIEVPAGQTLVQSVDFFRSFLDDPLLFGEIAAIHALGDVWAMGGRPHSALALAVVPLAAEHLVEDDLFQMLAGARRVLDAAGAALIGGHSGEGAEMALGFSVNGLVERGRALRKGGLRPGDALLLSKPLGTGAIFAAAMRARARARWIEAALALMRRPSGDAAQALVAAGAHACTDVTGFGLAGHLAEMIRASGRGDEVAVDLALDDLPLLDGAAELVGAGIVSSLQAENLRARHLIDGPERWHDDPRAALLFDPQTAGGLLAALPADQAAALAKRDASFRIVGHVHARDPARPPIRLV